MGERYTGSKSVAQGSLIHSRLCSAHRVEWRPATEIREDFYNGRMFIAGQSRYIGKETDRKWDQGGDFSLLAFKPAHFDELGKVVEADQALIERIMTVPIKVLVRTSSQQTCLELPFQSLAILPSSFFAAGG